MLGDLVREVAGLVAALLVACAVAAASSGAARAGPRVGALLAGVVVATALALAVADAGQLVPPRSRSWDRAASALSAALRAGVGLAIVWTAALAAVAALPLSVARRGGAGPGGQAAAGAAAGLAAAVPAMPGPPGLLLGVLTGAAMGFVASQVVPTAAPAGPRRAWLPVVLGVAAMAPALGAGHHALLPALLRAARPAGAPEPRSIEALLLDAARAQRRHLDRTGTYCRDLASLAGVDSAVTTTVGQGYVFRHAWLGRGRAWALAADPMPPLPGLPYLVVRLPGPTTEPRVETEAGPARLGP